MIKKSFGVALLAASVLVMGCSSNDDAATDTAGTATATAGTGTATEGGTTEGEGATTEGEGATTEGEGATTEGEGATTEGEGATTEGEGATTEGEGATTEGEGGTTEGEGTTTEGEGTTTGGEGLSYNANSVMGLIAANPNLSILAGALNPDFDQPLDTANQGWTVFAPTNAALQAAIDSGAEVNTAVLQSHIYTQGGVASSGLSGGQVLSMSNNSMYTITVGDGGTLLINGIAIIEADLPADNGALHIIDGVLLPNN